MVNYNNSQLSINCCNSLIPQFKEIDGLIVIVDNDSREEEKELLIDYCNKKDFIDVVFMRNNIGYFPAMAEGQKFAYAKGEYDYMIIANNDLIYSANFINTLKSMSVSNKVMAISPDIVTLDGIHQNPHFINKITPFRRFLYSIYYSNWYIAQLMHNVLHLTGLVRHEKNKPQYDAEGEIYLGFGACFILTKFYMDKVQLVDTSSFLMGEEMLLKHQIEESGGKIYYYPLLHVKHLDSATFSSNTKKFAYENMQKAYKIYRHYW